MQLPTGFSVALIIRCLAWRVKMLSLSGPLAASVVCGKIFGLGGLPWLAFLDP